MSCQVLYSNSRTGDERSAPIRRIISRGFGGSNQTSWVGSGRVGSVGSADPTRPANFLRCADLSLPDPRDSESPLTRPDSTRPDPTRPVIFQNLLTRPDPTHEISKPPDPTRPATFRLTPRHGFHAGRVTMTHQAIYLDPRVGPADPASGPALKKQFNYSCLCPAAVRGLAVVGADGCGQCV